MLRFNFNDRDLYNEASDYWNKGVKKGRRIALAAGIIMLVIGVLCLIFPFDSAYVMEMLASIMILAIGIAEIAAYVRMPVYLRIGGILAGGILNLILGLLLITSPSKELLAVFGFMFAIDLIAAGVEQISTGGRLGFLGIADTGWFNLNGIINIIAGIIFLFMPTTSAAVLSIVVAIFMIAGGVSLLIASHNMKELKRHDENDDIIDVG